MSDSSGSSQPARRCGWWRCLVPLLVVAASVVPAAAAPAAVPSVTSSGGSVAVNVRFDGIYRDQFADEDPADTQVAVGPRYVVELVNGGLEAWDKTDPGGSPIWSRLEYDVLQANGDARIVYDAGSGRFFAVGMTSDSVTLAVSATSDPRDAWYVDTLVAEYRDQPSLTVSADKVLVGDNGPDLWVVQKSDLLAATSSPVTARTTHVIRCDGLACKNVAIPSADPTGTTAYAVRRYDDHNRSTNRLQSNVDVEAVTGTPAAGNVALRTTPVVLSQVVHLPPDAPQRGTNMTIDGGLSDPYGGIVRGGRIWVSLGDTCTPAGDSTSRVCGRIIAIDVAGGAPTLARDVDLGVPGQYVVFPAVTADAAGDAIVTATMTSAASYPSVVAFALPPIGPPTAPVTLRAGESYNLGAIPGPTTRWGDYSGAAPDPTAPGEVWLAGMYAGADHQWGTGLGAVAFRPAGTLYTPLPPSRVLDTRIGLGGPRLGHDAALTLPLAGRNGVPADATAVTLNLVAVNAAGGGYLTVYPTGQPGGPATSSLNVIPGQALANQVTVPLAADGSVTVFNATTGSDAVADLAGYYTAGAAGDAYTPLSPRRVLDTRIGLGAPAGPLGPGHSLTLTLPGSDGLPAHGVAGLLLNLVAVTPSGAGYLSAYPTGQGSGTRTSSLNFSPHQTVANQIIVPPGDGQSITIYCSATTSAHVVADLAGYFTAPTSATPVGYHPFAPYRILDTRTGLGAPPGPLPAGHTLTLSLAGAVPAGTQAVAVNLVAVNPPDPGYLSAYPGPTRPGTSTLNYSPPHTEAHLTTVPLASDGTITLYNAAGNVHLVADLQGYYATNP